ncbi:cupin domain-containing protein [Anaerocolumna sp. AGMB13025]|jgi:quercetin dioxygenase-like cupin family protein|uniref:cupin domain-containing protein n=1 Tax=Anaerocolumna sp. AGMB13025 TaxID=3039116 RepID=UPI00241EB731|nr:cupin domain-containing protein [Anaerocolumna sp. AGMB13025]WFR59812.1 cupin domain-containing protein [Anaerocolumna sp. AGMB13025]
MDKKILKNIDFAAVLNLKEQVNYQTGQIVSKTLIQNQNVSLTLFAFDKGEEISSHTSNGDAMITVTDGTSEITIGDQVYSLSEGQTIVMPAQIPHAVYAREAFKMTLTVVF